MNVADFTYLLQHPEKVNSPVQAKQLEDILEEYPYFQAARAIHLKGLRNLNSFKYNNALKITAAYTTDREILFDFITSKDFLQNTIADTIGGKTTALADTETIAEEVLTDKEVDTTMIEGSEDNPLPQNIGDAEQILDPTLFKSKDPAIDKSIAEAKKKSESEIGQDAPVSFTKNEKYSFAQWLQLTSVKSINRSSPKETATEKEPPPSMDFPLEEAVLRKKKFELIDKFINENPKIIPSDSSAPKVPIKASSKINKNELMTQTLAKVYLEQKKYKKAIQAYKILSLKYPEKSGFFADRIKAVEKIQKENT
ncbi:hypothetical protein [Spongiimicrobium salis]|uniref:hypothetical protein n=1 Tax=Spongiimicrobium salis TaxID=1667022 RepID=UPI00374DF780